MAGFIAMISMFVVVGIEMFFATKGAGHSHGGDYDSLPTIARTVADEGALNKLKKPASLRRFQSDMDTEEAYRDTASEIGESHSGSNLALIRSNSSSDGKRKASHDADDSDLELDDYELPEIVDGPSHAANGKHHPSRSSHTHRPPTTGLTDYQQQQRALLQCLLLEAGILFHSIFIGMAVSVASGTPFIVLLIAISFHQTFEGLALGSRIAGITAFDKGSIKPWLMALAYGTTTPIGQAIGLVVHNLYDPRSETGLLMVGVMNAISSGLLLFAGLVELMAEDFLSEKSYETLQGRRRIEASAAVVAGSMLMALVGAWA